MLTTCDKRPETMSRAELRTAIGTVTARVADLDRALLRPAIGPATLAILAESRVDLAMYRATLQAALQAIPKS